MGAKPASGELNKALRPIFSKIPGVHIIHDDVVVATKTTEEHEQTLKEVLRTCAELGLTLNPNKCIFKKSEIPFWGMIVSKDGVRPDPSKVQALKDASRPRTKNELMSFLCMVQGLSRVSAPAAELGQTAMEGKVTTSTVGRSSLHLQQDRLLLGATTQW